MAPAEGQVAEDAADSPEKESQRFGVYGAGSAWAVHIPGMDVARLTDEAQANFLFAQLMLSRNNAVNLSFAVAPTKPFKFDGDNSEDSIERQLQSKNLNAPRLKPAHIDAVIVSETFTVLPSGKCMVCEITLRNGFTVRGESSCVSRANFDEEIGRQISYKNAREKIWQLEAYLLQERSWGAEHGVYGDV